MATIVFDIETKPLAGSHDPESTLSPATASIAMLSMYDPDLDRGVIYVVEGNSVETALLNGWIYKSVSEEELLREFWEGAEVYEVFVGYGTRRFDIPFIITRSLAYNIKPSINLINQRRVSQQTLPLQVDLLDEFSFYGQMSRCLSLRQAAELYCAVDQCWLENDEVQPLFQKERTDALCTHGQTKILTMSRLYTKWKEHLAPPNFYNTIEL